MKTLTPGAFCALRAYKQADEDGGMVLVSRQALDEAIAVLYEQMVVPTTKSVPAPVSDPNTVRSPKLSLPAEDEYLGIRMD